jgi:UDP-glucose 4-epimerase
MKILVVGGAGYIGSHMVKALTKAGHDVVTLDNLCTGHRDSVRYGRLFEADLRDCAVLDGLLATEGFDGVMHFASFIQVGESVTDPAKYYRNNVANTQNLLDSIVRHGMKHFIFSSTAAIFGKPEYIPIDEEHPKRPLNPYGRTKLMVEEMLADYDRAYGLKSVSLRYFNAAGADPHGELGERHEPETHLIPLLLQAACSPRGAITLFGTDYDTPDGTCIRDYIHVSDLCDAHLLALESLLAGQGSAAYNLGNGNGYSVREVIEAAREVTQQPIRIIESVRRPGDPDRLVANSRLARERLGWKPRFADLEQIIAHAWAWEVRSTATVA